MATYFVTGATGFIGRNLLEIDKYLKGKNYTYEIIVVEDGSPDNTAEVVRNYALQIPHLHEIDMIGVQRTE